MVGVTKLRIKFSDAKKKAEKSMDENVFNHSNKSKKRGSNELEEVQSKKKQKLDRDLSRQCSTLLRFLMENQTGFMLFNEPVDPVKLKIPDYFSVISKPMDLGTIESKLSRNVYNNVEEFAADVRLTFDNAMTYNPPDNSVHKIAKKCKQIFEVRWEPLKKKLSRIGVTKGKPLELDCSRQSSSEKSASNPMREKSEKVSLLSKPLKGHIKKETSSLRVKQPDLGLGISPTVKIPNKELKMPFPDMPPLPPDKALRAATLKAKYAKTILKAKLQKVLHQSNKVDRINIQIEKEEMERAQRAEKARIEAEIRDAKIASQMREQTERKENRQRERLKVEEMKPGSPIHDDNDNVMNDLINIAGSSYPTKTTLSELGLFLKKKYDCMEEMEFEVSSDSFYIRVDDDLEEGEII